MSSVTAEHDTDSERTETPAPAPDSADEPASYKARTVEPRVVQLECVFFGTLREAVGEKTVRFETSAETVGGLLADLESAYPSLEDRLVADEGDGPSSRVVVTKNERDVSHIEGVETRLEESDVIRLVPTVYC